MTEHIASVIMRPEYDFLRTDPHLKDRIIFLCYGGSYSYGTNIEGSDIDVRGCAAELPSDLIGNTNFEQYTDNATDTTVYGFNKLVSLISACNPNTIEMLGCKPEHYTMMTPIGMQLINNRKMFLSRRAIHSFGGYANQQLQRLKNAIARDRGTQSDLERHIHASCIRRMGHMNERYRDFGGGQFEMFIDKSDKSDMETEIFTNITLSHYPLRDFKGMVNELNDVVKEYGKLNHRNRKDEFHLNKHAMHLVRLYLMCFDILEQEEVITYRDKDHDFLMSIRNGEFQNPDGTYREEFFELIDEYENRLKYDEQHTSLPKHPDMKRINDFVMSVNKSIIMEG